MTFDEANALLSPTTTVQSIMDVEERRALWDAVSERPLCEVIEIGCAYGGTTGLLALAGAARVYAIENWQCGKRADFLANIESLGVESVVHEVVGGSQEVVGEFTDDSAWVVLVDGDHGGLAPLHDLMRYWPKVTRGGYLFVDDVGNGHPDVDQAVRMFEAESEGIFARFFTHTQADGNTKLVGYRRGL